MLFFIITGRFMWKNPFFTPEKNYNFAAFSLQRCQLLWNILNEYCKNRRFFSEIITLFSLKRTWNTNVSFFYYHTQAIYLKTVCHERPYFRHNGSICSTSRASKSLSNRNGKNLNICEKCSRGSYRWLELGLSYNLSPASERSGN